MFCSLPVENDEQNQIMGTTYIGHAFCPETIKLGSRSLSLLWKVNPGLKVFIFSF